MDIAGPFPVTTRNNKYFIVIVDTFTKWSEIYPLIDTQAKSVADVVVNEWISRYGVPIHILSDQGTNFQSMLLEMLYEYLDIRRLRTTAFHPQCDGESERFIQTVKNMISSYVDENQTNWDTHLMMLAFAYNSSIHSSTKVTPFELTFGRKPRLPCDIAFGPEIPLVVTATNPSEYYRFFENFDRYKKNLPAESIDYLISIKTKLSHMFKIAQNNKLVTMDKAKFDHDRKIKKSRYEIGDLVLTDHPKLTVGISSGLAHRYWGPFKIIAINSNGVNYSIQRCKSKNKKIYQIHVSRLKMYYGHHLENHNEPVENRIIKRKYRKNPTTARWNKNNIENPQEIDEDHNQIENGVNDDGISRPDDSNSISQSQQDQLEQNDLPTISPSPDQSLNQRIRYNFTRKYTKRKSCNRWKLQNTSEKLPSQQIRRSNRLLNKKYVIKNFIMLLILYL